MRSMCRLLRLFPFMGFVCAPISVSSLFRTADASFAFVCPSFVHLGKTIRESSAPGLGTASNSHAVSSRPSRTKVQKVSLQAEKSPSIPAEQPQREAVSWDLPGLKKEADRHFMRVLKKIDKANQRLTRLRSLENEVTGNSPDDMTEADVETLLQELHTRREALVELKEGLQKIKKPTNPSFEPLVDLAQSLGVSDTPPERPPPKPKKKKQPPAGPRLPYTSFTSFDGIEIRVGRRADDNDVLSTNPQYRDGADWWMHTAGCPGSHVVIRSHDDSLPRQFPETLLDAAALAVKNSKAKNAGGRQTVSLVRCRQVKKPAGAKPGLVQLNGSVASVKVDIVKEAGRLLRLESQIMRQNQTNEA